MSTAAIIATTKLNQAIYARAQHEKKYVAALARGDVKEAAIQDLRLRRAKERVIEAEKTAREAGAL